MKLNYLFLVLAFLNLSSIQSQQKTESEKQKKKASEMVVERERPKEWNNLVLVVVSWTIGIWKVKLSIPSILS
ncbi:hypothetical protein [Zobellia barbeyronii]|uniref:Uncharacterized protein n=1 Tax=Zobellia barbeyronii TaxID=2748009 RepID=A0ABS5WHI2_9FLAO|nr:hypothetical protein [Zobellia barbeyronii]MBT2162635.1 hypothetical protein [Zobellia barbeyronii]